MTLTLLHEYDLPPEGVVEFKWKASSNTSKLQIKRLLVQPALLVYPTSVSRAEIEKHLLEFPIYLYLKSLQEKPVRNPFQTGYHTRKHVLYIEYNQRVRSIESQLLFDGVRIFTPWHRPIDSYRVQRFAYEYLVQFLYREAETLLYPYVLKCAKTVGLSFNKMKITAPSLKWGSCSSQRTLIFSVFAMLLPNELLRYLVYHELTHLTHLNHSAAFWELLSEYLDEDARLLDKKLQEYTLNSLPIPELF